jgi:RHS repeat-associated protein
LPGLFLKSDGEELSATDPLGSKTQETFDSFGNVATTTDALGNTAHYSYDYLGDQTMAVLPSGSATTSVYDGLGELDSVTDGVGDKSSQSYNDQGELAVATAPDGTSEQYSYDGAGRQVATADLSAPDTTGGAGTVLRAEYAGYDGDGNQVASTDWDGVTSTSSFNAADELTGEVKPISSSSSVSQSFSYDAVGNRTLVTDGNGNETWTTYNAWNLPESVVEPGTPSAPSPADTTWTTSYTADGEPSAVSEPGGVSLSFGYDPLGDITSESGSGASAATLDRSFTYDVDGRMASASAPGGTDDFTYNADGDLKSTSGPSGSSSYDYNSDALVSSETDAAGTTSYTYDGADRVATESDPLTGATQTNAYNSDSDPSSISYMGSDGSAGATESFGYDGLERQTSDTVTAADGTVLASESYGYDADGNLISQTDGGLLPASTVTYGYDEADRVTSAASGGSTTDYGYDGDGNLVTDGPVSNTFNAQDQLVSSTDSGGGATTGYSYTLNGALSQVTPASGSVQDYTWDAYGDLASAPGGVSYASDALGRTVTRTDSSGSTSMSYLGTGGTVASDGTDEYSYSPSGALTAEGTSGGTASAVMSDIHGDVSAAFDPSGSTNALTGSESYSAYGSASTLGQVPGLGYQGDYTDPVTGLVEMGARWYNPATGTFVSSDTLNGSPVPSTVDGNPYAYADGNPLTNTDPSGHCGLACWIGVLACDDDPVCAAGETFWNGIQGSLVSGCKDVICETTSPEAEELPPPLNPPVPAPRQSSHDDCDEWCGLTAIPVGTTATCTLEPEICAAPLDPVLPPPPPPDPDCYTSGKCKPTPRTDEAPEAPASDQPRRRQPIHRAAVHDGPLRDRELHCQAGPDQGTPARLRRAAHRHHHRRRRPRLHARQPELCVLQRSRLP